MADERVKPDSLNLLFQSSDRLQCDLKLFVRLARIHAGLKGVNRCL